MTTTCIGCDSHTVKTIIDLGLQPPSNRFLASGKDACETHHLQFGYCSCCNLAQLVNPMPSDMVRSHHAWISYNEPEGHLDGLVDCLCEIGEVTERTRIFGVTYKDDSTLARFGKLGVIDTYRLDQKTDLGINESLANLETIQSELTADRAREVADRIGLADIVFVRHILEHAHRPVELLEACQHLVKPGGLLVFEVPDCRKVLDGQDHCFIWEEHITYFVPETLKSFLKFAGFHDVIIKVYPYPMEDSLIAIVRNERAAPIRPTALKNEESRLQHFGTSFLERGALIKNHLQSLQAQGAQIVLFGAGHLAVKFINFYGLAPFLCGIIDDNPNKQDLFLPASALPIIDSHQLENGKIVLCLLTLNPESEQKVLKANAGYVERGGKFRSIFSASSNSINLDL